MAHLINKKIYEDIQLDEDDDPYDDFYSEFNCICDTAGINLQIQSDHNEGYYVVFIGMVIRPEISYYNQSSIISNIGNINGINEYENNFKKKMELFKNKFDFSLQTENLKLINMLRFC